LIPGFSALLIKQLGIPTTCSRVDVVGMGCNAGLNALGPVAAWASAHPGELAVMVCIEVCSAMYIDETSVRTSVVNSLFGDGAAAMSVIADTEDDAAGPRLLGFSSCMIPEAIDAMRIDWREDHGKFSFSLDAAVPYVVGLHAEGVVDRLLHDAGLRRSDVAHWLIHSGGKKVIDAARVNLGLTRADVRHTLSVLRDFGNLSSGSFLFSYERFVEEGLAEKGDYGVMMTMGPGSTIETALLQW
jgi:predicted naringenin-chalcone synthase